MSVLTDLGTVCMTQSAIMYCMHDTISALQVSEALVWLNKHYTACRAYNLPCQWVIHTVGPVFERRHARKCEQMLHQAYRCISRKQTLCASDVAGQSHTYFTMMTTPACVPNIPQCPAIALTFWQK